MTFLLKKLVHENDFQKESIINQIFFQFSFFLIALLITSGNLHGCAVERTIQSFFNEETAEKIANVLSILGTKRSWVVSGDDGMDEITTTTTSSAWEVTGSKIRPFVISPEDAGIERASILDLKPTNTDESIAMFHESLSTESSPRKDIVLLSSGAGFTISGVTADIRAGVAMAREIVDSGEPISKLNALIEFSNTVN